MSVMDKKEQHATSLMLVTELQRMKEEYLEECELDLRNADLDSEKKRLKRHIENSKWWISECERWLGRNRKRY